MRAAAAIEWRHPGPCVPETGVERVPLPFLSVEELLRGLPEADLARFRAGCSERRFQRDAPLFLQGDPSDGACILREGLVKIVSLSEKGADRILHILRPGELFGELVLIDRPRPFAAIALTDVAVAFLPAAKLRDLLAASAVLSRNYLRLLSLRLHDVERSFPTLVHLWPHHRLAKELLHLAEDLGNETPKGTRMALRLTHEDLSNLIGASRETVTLLLHKFEEMGLLWREGRDLFLHRRRLAEYLALK